MARRINYREPRKPLKLVVGAGLTEYWYLKHLKSLRNLKIKLYPSLFRNESMKEINKLIEERLEERMEVIYFFDEDVTLWDNEEKERIKNLHAKYDDDSRVTLACSMPSIEYWFLLHYQHTNSFFATSRDTINALRKYIAQFDKKETFLKNQKWVADLISDGKMDAAMQRAESLGRSGESYTDVWKAFKAVK